MEGNPRIRLAPQHGSNPRFPLGSPEARWVIAASVLGSGIAFLDGTVVNVALPAIRRDLGGGLGVQQWVLDGYLLTLGSLLLLGGALGDRYGRRRVFSIGLFWFAAASAACGFAPSGLMLILTRTVQGAGAALLIPNSLALIDALIEETQRGRAVGIWAGLSGVSTALGPFLGGWLVEVVSWRLVFIINLPLAAAALAITGRHVPESLDPAAGGHRLDWPGASTAAIGLSGMTYAMIEVPAGGWTAATVSAAVGGAACLIAFPFVEARKAEPMVALDVFRSRQFTGANLTTLAVYAALGGALFLLALQLQESMGYSPLLAGLALLPVTVIMLLVSPGMGALAQRTGPRGPMTIGPLIGAVGLALMARVAPGGTYPDAVLPAVVLFGLGLSITVAPLTSAVLGSISEDRVGVASGTNNAVARLAGLLAVAILPTLAGVHAAGSTGLGPGFGRAMLIAAGVCGAGGMVAWATIRNQTPVRLQAQPGVNHGCVHQSTRTNSARNPTVSHRG